MKRKEMIKQIYWVAGMLEGFTYQTNLPEGMAMSLSECVERLELVGAQLITKDVHFDDGIELDSEKINQIFGRVYPAPLQEGTD